MIIEKIKLINFRNYPKCEVSFEKGINYIYGSNASGKTSLVESIYYLSLARSFRTTEDEHLINYESDFASIFSLINQYKQKKSLDVYLTKIGKKINLNKKQVRKISELKDVINCVYFIPKDVNLLKDPPKGRRLFLDLSISKLSNNYIDLISNYMKLLKERNEILRQKEINEILIETITDQMIEYSKEIYKYRKEYINNINEVISKIYKKITNSSKKIKIIYDSFIDNYENYSDLAKLEFKNCYENDRKHKQTSIGIQREDFFITQNGKKVNIYGSQGENRLVVLALKLSVYELVNDENLKPIIILDDVLSELDETHQTSLIKYLETTNQVFITSTNKKEINKATYFKVENNNVIKEVA